MNNITQDGNHIKVKDNSGDILRVVQNGDGKKVFHTTDTGLGMAQKLYTGLVNQVLTPHPGIIFLEHGCDIGVQSQVASTNNNVAEIIFHDVDQAALLHAHKWLKENNISQTYRGILGDEIDTLRGINLIASNLPQNPLDEYCGEGGSELQVQETLRLQNIMAPGGIILSKNVGYAQPITEFDKMRDSFHIDEHGGPMKCSNPNTGEDSTVQYYLLRKRG